MMLLGPVLHAGVGFTAQPSPVWPYQADRRSAPGQAVAQLTAGIIIW